jgi:hypothetical protein
VNDPRLVDEPGKIRWAANNYFTAHMRNIGLMAMSLDAGDDPGGTLRAYVGNATGAWLYVVDHAMRGDFRGGLFPEGFEYAPQTLGYVTQLLWALETAGENDTASRGRQAAFEGNPFWDELLAATLHSISPVPALSPSDEVLVYQPAWYGDGLRYGAGDLVGLFKYCALQDLERDKPGVGIAHCRWFWHHDRRSGLRYSLS